jgi:hypothetical protein
MFPWKKKQQQGWETRQRGWTEGTYEDIHVPSRVLTVTNRSAIIDYHVSINYLILRCQPVVISLSLSEIVTSMLISRCQAIALSHTHTSSSPRCLFPGVKTSSLSLPQNCHLDAYFQVSNHRLSLSLTELSPRCLFPGVKPSSLSLSLT